MLTGIATLVALGLTAAPLMAQNASADFSVPLRSGHAPFSVPFTNLSSADTIVWQWMFGDGSTSTEYEPVHEYTAPGTYTVSLFVAGTGFDTEIKQDFIEVLPPDLAPQVSASSTSGAFPLTVEFTDLDPGNAADQWLWEFGDGATSTEATPTHVYWQEGVHDVTLTTSFGDFSESVVAQGLITVEAPSLMQPSFTAAPIWGAAPLVVTFAYAGKGLEPETFLWEFGDGATSTERDPVHSYAGAGMFDVTLTTRLGAVTEGVQAPGHALVSVPDVAFTPIALTPHPIVGDPYGLLDVTGDGHLDLLSLGATVEVFAGDGAGGLGAPLVSPLAGALYGLRSGIGDLDQDGAPDIVGAVFLFSGTWSLDELGNDGSGSFALSHAQPMAWADQAGTRIAVGDVTGDGWLDAVAAHKGVLSVFPNGGDGTLRPPGVDQPEVDPGPVPVDDAVRIDVADFDMDGHLDVLARTAFLETYGWVVYRGDGAGHLDFGCGSWVGDTSAGHTLVGDVDADGMPDIVSGWSAPHLCAQGGSEKETHVDSWAAGCPGDTLCDGDVVEGVSQTTALVDIDARGGADLIVGGGAQVDVVLSAGGGVFSERMLLPGLPKTTQYPHTRFGDLDGDGLPDAAGDDPSGFVWTSRNLTPAEGWSEWGGGLAGPTGEPVIDASGGSAAGDPAVIAVTGAMPNAPLVLVIGVGQLGAPFQGGTLVPRPDLLLYSSTDGSGNGTFVLPWPSQLGPGFTSYWQAWIGPFTAPSNPAATTGLRHVMPLP